MWQVEVSHKSEMAGPFNRGDTKINKQFTFICQMVPFVTKMYCLYSFWLKQKCVVYVRM